MINFDNSVTNVLNTPAIIANTTGNLPAANSVAIGTLYIDTTNPSILRSDGTSWYIYSSGGVSGIDTVLGVNQILTAYRDIDLNNQVLSIIDNTQLSPDVAQFAWGGIVLGHSNNGLIMNFNTNQYDLGSELTFLNINASGNNIITYLDGNKIGINLGLNAYKFGDFDGVYNGTRIEMNDSAEYMLLYAQAEFELNTNLIRITGSVTTTGVHTPTAQHLKINVNGTSYTIQLLTP